MIIDLNDKYQIRTDAYNYILQEKTVPNANHHMTKNTNEIRLKDVGYYRNYSHLVNALIEKDIKESGALNLKEVVNVIEETKISITKQLENKELA